MKKSQAWFISDLKQCSRLIKDIPPKFNIKYETIFPSQNIRERERVYTGKNCAWSVAYQSKQSNRNSLLVKRECKRDTDNVILLLHSHKWLNRNWQKQKRVFPYRQAGRSACIRQSHTVLFGAVLIMAAAALAAAADWIPLYVLPGHADRRHSKRFSFTPPLLPFARFR